ncbi:UDP-sulfoquinovose synthase [Vulcanisaeta thermophila]|uniref:UDP-sulfoquinovose synthase n=1 Tax=Vulcanisaeta thermophila TaxID=867917 RepID=UPI000853CAD4|nr:UDP-sulfoquinovose synthase [Vulcanisaeta thermophila]
MRVLILGIDGYLGWALTLRLIRRGHEVAGIDNFYTRKAVSEVGSDSALPILPMSERLRVIEEVFGAKVEFVEGDVTNYELLKKVIERFRPDVVVHFAEQRSAPYSMIDVEHARYTMINNLTSTLNLIYAIKELGRDIHILKMGTLGEYGYPAFRIPEDAFVDAVINGARDRIVVPRWAGSWYHWSKVFDSYILLYANKLWGLTITDFHQGPVYGSRTRDLISDELFTRFDIDDVWGTVINRFLAQAIIKHPLTIYGSGHQKKGFTSLEDTVTALTALIENPPSPGEFRVVHHYREIKTLNEMAELVRRASIKVLGYDPGVTHIPNPRVEPEDEVMYEPERRVLPKLGIYGLSRIMEDEVEVMLRDLARYRDRIDKLRGVIMPRVRWRG